MLIFMYLASFGYFLNSYRGGHIFVSCHSMNIILLGKYNFPLSLFRDLSSYSLNPDFGERCFRILAIE